MTEKNGTCAIRLLVFDSHQKTRKNERKNKEKKEKKERKGRKKKRAREYELGGVTSSAKIDVSVI